MWLAFKLVSLSDWKQPLHWIKNFCWVVICFQISIFERLETTNAAWYYEKAALWFAFKLVSLSDWKQLNPEKSLCCSCLVGAVGFENGVVSEIKNLNTLRFFIFKIVPIAVRRCWEDSVFCRETVRWRQIVCPSKLWLRYVHIQGGRILPV